MKRILAWLGVWLVFCLFPVLLIGTGIRAFYAELARVDWEILNSNLQQWTARQTQAGGDTKRVLQKELESLGRRAFHSATGPDRVVLTRGMKSLERRFPLKFHWYPLDAGGSPVPGLSDPHASAGILRRLYQVIVALSQDQVEGERLLTRYWAMLLSFLGKESHQRFLPIVGGRSMFNPADSTSERAWFFGMIASGGALFAHLGNPAGFDMLGMNDRITRLAPFLKKHRWTMGLQKYPGLPTNDPELNLALGDYRLSGIRTRRGDRAIITLQSLPTGGLVWLKIPRSTLPDRSSAPSDHFLGIVLAVCTLMCFRCARSQSEPRISIRWRLLSLFLIAVTLPLTALILAGWDYLAQKERLQYELSRTLLERRLREIDSRFPSFTNAFGSRLRDTIKENPPPLGSSKQALDQWTGEMRERFQITTIEVVDAQGLPLSRSIKPRSTITGAAMFRSYCREMIGWLNGRRGASISTIGSLWGNQQDLVSETGKIVTWNLLDQPYSMFVSPIAGTTPGSWSAAVFGLWELPDLAFASIDKECRNEARRLPGSIFHFSMEDREQFFPPRAHARRVSLGGTIRSVQAGLEGGKDSAFLRSPRYGGLHAVGIGGANLPHMRLLAIRSDRPILREVRRWRKGLIWFSLFSFGFALYLAFLLSSQVLAPLAQLTEGIAALQDHDFKKRLPPGPADEFGDLMLTFNHMLEGLSDLEVGRIVQESLFPTALTKGAGWQTIGRSQPATQVGGDFYDIQPLSDGRLLVLIGDVTGHGVAPGLVMAMVKGLVELEIERKTEPLRLMTAIHVVLSQSLPWFYQMTACLGIVDPTGPRGPVLHLVSAGHPPPFLYRAGATPFQFKVSSMPLGIRHRPRLGTLEHPLEPGDILFFFTDGWYEALDTSGKALGFTRLGHAAEKLIDADLEASRDRLFAWIETTCGAQAHTDDLTLLLVRIDRS